MGKVDEDVEIRDKANKNPTIDQKVDLFYSSIKSRMLVAEVVKRIRSGALFTFDYVALVCLASIIAFFGLLENSSVVLVASMLVSPIMGPILAGIFGAVISDKELRNKGIKHETISLLLCIFIGFVLGLCFSVWIEFYGVTKWPTDEMISRGQLRALGVGALIAIPSGAGVALSVLGDNTGSMVGVAISASLLPPAVNAGLFWALALVNHDPLFIGIKLHFLSFLSFLSKFNFCGTMALCSFLLIYFVRFRIRHKREERYKWNN